MVSSILDAINSLKAQILAIDWDWSTIPDAQRNRADKLFQKVLVFNDQISRMNNNKGYLVNTPALFIEMEIQSTDELTMGVTYSQVCWKFHLVHRQLDAGNDIDMDENLLVYEYRDALRTALMEFQPESCSTLAYEGEQQDYDHGNLYHYVINYKCGFKDIKGSVYDPDQKKYIYTTPPTNLELQTGFWDGETPPDDPLINYIWKVCEVRAILTDTPNPANTQTLANGAVIPLEYAPNLDGTFTMPYLKTTPGIALLSSFFIDNQPYPDVMLDNVTGVLDNSANGGFGVGDEIRFDASLPLGVTS